MATTKIDLGKVASIYPLCYCTFTASNVEVGANSHANASFTLKMPSDLEDADWYEVDSTNGKIKTTRAGYMAIGFRTQAMVSDFNSDYTYDFAVTSGVAGLSDPTMYMKSSFSWETASGSEGYAPLTIVPFTEGQNLSIYASVYNNTSVTKGFYVEETMYMFPLFLQ